MRIYRLLIVDEDVEDRRVYSNLLAKLGSGACHIRQALGGAAGLQELCAGPFDCVLLDSNLSDMTWPDFLAAAKVDGELPCAVVLVTGQDDEAVAVEAMKLGVHDCLAKRQVNASNLWRAMTHAVAKTELRQQMLRASHDRAAASIAIEHEIIARKAAEADLRTATDATAEAALANSHFAAIVAQELRTHLDGILGHARFLRTEAGPAAPRNMHTTAITHSAEHLLEMIECVLDVTTLEAGRSELHPERISVHDLIEDCVAIATPVATEHGLSLRVANSVDAPSEVLLDPTRLRQVILCLLAHVVKHAGGDSVELRTATGAVPGSLRVAIADDFYGASAEHDRLFRDLRRDGDPTRIQDADLALAIAERTIELMGGILYHTASPRGGNVFWFELQAGVVDLPPRRERTARPPLSSGQRVLLVDDIAMNRDVIGVFLEAAGHTVTQAEGGEEAVWLASEHPFDLILMDVRMPGVDGLEATRRIRTLDGAPGRVPILALTAHSSPDLVQKCLDAGMNGHLAKPVDYDTLMDAIDHAIAGATLCPAD
jgi:CheY-like chemotaxis protein